MAAIEQSSFSEIHRRRTEEALRGKLEEGNGYAPIAPFDSPIRRRSPTAGRSGNELTRGMIDPQFVPIGVYSWFLNCIVPARGFRRVST